MQRKLIDIINASITCIEYNATLADPSILHLDVHQLVNVH